MEKEMKIFEDLNSNNRVKQTSVARCTETVECTIGNKVVYARAVKKTSTRIVISRTGGNDKGVRFK